MVLELYNGSETIDLIDDTNYLTESYTPNIPPLGSQDRYEDAIERIGLVIRGATVAQAVANKTKLWQFLDQATRWADGERGVAPVVFRVRVQGSALAQSLQTICLGWADKQGFQLPSSLLSDAGRYIIPNVSIAFRRTGWLLDSEVSSLSANLLLDSDFRHGYWTFSTGAGSVTVQELTATPDGIAPPSGLGVKYFQNFTGVYGDNYRESDQTVAVTAGEQLTFSFDFAVAGGATGSSSYLKFTGPSSFVQYVLIPFGTLSNLWQRRSLTVTVPVGATAVGVRWGVQSTAGWWLSIGAMQLERAAVASAWNASHIGDNTAILTATFAQSISTRSPASIALAGFGQVATPTIAASWLVTTDSPTNIRIVDWPGSIGQVSAPFSVVADSANRALGSAVQRYTPTGTSKVSAGAGSLPTTMIGELAVLILARNNSSTTSFILSMKLKGSGITQETEIGVVGPYTSSAAPKVVPLPGLVNDYGHESFELFVQATAASGSLDIDRIIFVRITPATTVLQLDAIDVANGLATSASAKLEIQSRALTHLRPFPGAVNTTNSADVAVATAHGNTLLLSTGNQIAVLWLAPYSSFWPHVDDGTSGDPTTRLTLTAKRHPAYLTPQ
jgi:hypothetical protein